MCFQSQQLHAQSARIKKLISGVLRLEAQMNQKPGFLDARNVLIPGENIDKKGKYIILNINKYKGFSHKYKMEGKLHLSFRERDGNQRTITLSHGESLFNAKCPVDGTQLINAIGEENYYISCPNCRRIYYSGSHPSTCTQEGVNKKYQEEIEDRKEQLSELRADFQQKQDGLCKTIAELETPFTQDGVIR